MTALINEIKHEVTPLCKIPGMPNFVRAKVNQTGKEVTLHESAFVKPKPSAKSDKAEK